jgi:hypothetical protein
MQRYHSVAITAAIALCSLLPVSESHAQAHTKGTPVPPFTRTLKPGDYVWHPKVSPGLLFSGKTGTPPGGGFVWTPEKSPQGPVSIILSAPDRRTYVYRKGAEIGRAPVTGLETARLSGTYVYSADSGTDSAGRRDWISTASVGRKPPNLKDLEDRISIDSNFLQDVRAIISPGTTLVLTDAPVSSQTHSGTGFNILTADTQ